MAKNDHLPRTFSGSCIICDGCKSIRGTALIGRDQGRYWRARRRRVRLTVSTARLTSHHNVSRQRMTPIEHATVTQLVFSPYKHGGKSALRVVRVPVSKFEDVDSNSRHTRSCVSGVYWLAMLLRRMQLHYIEMTRSFRCNLLLQQQQKKLYVLCPFTTIKCHLLVQL